LERLQYGYPSHIQNINYKSKRREFTMQNALLFTLPFSYPFFFIYNLALIGQIISQIVWEELH